MSGTTTWSIIGPIVLLGRRVRHVGRHPWAQTLTAPRSGAGWCSGLFGLGALGVVTGSTDPGRAERAARPGPAARPDRLHVAGPARQHLALLLGDGRGHAARRRRRTR